MQQFTLHTLICVSLWLSFAITPVPLFACSNMFTSYTRDGYEITVLNTDAEIPLSQHVYYLRLHHGEHPFSTLMREASLIIIGRAAGIAWTEGGGRIVPEHGVLDPFVLRALCVDTCIAATVDKQTYCAMLTTWRGTSNILFYVQHMWRPAPFDTVPRDRWLNEGSQYLLFLKEYPICSQDLNEAKCEVLPPVVFKAVLHEDGILLVNRADARPALLRTLPPVPEEPNDPAKLNAVFFTNDISAIVQAVQCMASAMRDDRLAAPEQKKADFERAQKLLSFGRNADIADLTNYARFKYLK